ncbi:hypothetical protein [Prosthecobacter vanneervenii]|uniref:Uncharacterized protein n=1 Tax=Prosthecobacter vanneervenii TaxID=48466 RepID=A0A7W8DM81_9BACT|nr:hypothetical protein [Prosthecobacter vanneervenii]MBB5034626.1 hypothetical protein [Prosthecobacter vanneervenii]
MGADQTAEIRPALRELFDAVANNESNADTLCVTFTVPEHPEIWVQVMNGTINAAYPRSSDPTDFLHSTKLPAIPGLRLESWQANQYATWLFSSCGVDSLAEFIDLLFTALHSSLADDYSIDVVIEYLS